MLEMKEIRCLLLVFIYLAVLALQLQHVGSSSLSREHTGPPALGTGILSHWTTRKSLYHRTEGLTCNEAKQTSSIVFKEKELSGW